MQPKAHWERGTFRPAFLLVFWGWWYIGSVVNILSSQESIQEQAMVSGGIYSSCKRGNMLLPADVHNHHCSLVLPDYRYSCWDWNVSINRLSEYYWGMSIPPMSLPAFQWVSLLLHIPGSTVTGTNEESTLVVLLSYPCWYCTVLYNSVQYHYWVCRVLHIYYFDAMFTTTLSGR